MVVKAEEAEGRTLFAAWRAGDEDARGQLIDLFYRELTLAAAAMLRRERSVSLSSGDLVHECVLRLIRLRRIAVEDRVHFLVLASRFMRRTLIDHVRAKHADKREHEQVTMTTRFEQGRPVDLRGLDEALIRLRSLDAERSEIVEMRYFGGMTLADIAEALSLSEATVKRRWAGARAWLIEAMDEHNVALRSCA